MKNLIRIFVFSFLLLHSCSKIEYPIVEDVYLIEGFSDALSNSKKKEILDHAYESSLIISSDSLKEKMFLEISYQYLRLKDSSAFLRSNKVARTLAVSLQDSTAIASTYWDLAHFYHDYSVEDSAYFYYNNAQKVYERMEDNLNSAKLLLNMALLQKDIKDFTGSEVTTTLAITLLKPLKENYQLYRAYNNLGTVFSELEGFDLALQYYQSAKYFLEENKRQDLFYSVWNNIGVVYHKQGEYEQAIKYFDNALNYKDNLFITDPKMYAMLLDNRAYAQLKTGDTLGVGDQLLEALLIRQDLEYKPGITVNQLHLSEFFLSLKDTASTVRYAQDAKKIAKKSNNMRDLLSSLQILSSTTGDSSLAYANLHIKLTDSLQKVERATRNKFARIRFETEEHISETERLNQRVLRISYIGFGVLVIFVLLYIIKDQRSRNKFMKQKQYANKEIYNLLLAQQKNFEEGREKEKQHISRELHDGVLGKLFGVRLSLDSLNEEDTPDIKKKRFGYIEEIQKIAEEIRLISHRLNKTPIVEVDFKKVLEELIAKQNRENITFQIRSDDSIKWNGIEDDVKLNIYRIIQEAINNIHKHSEATEAYVHFQKNGNELILKIEDNGKGIDQMQIPKGIGIQNMKTRAKNIGGKLEIISGKTNKSGTMVKLSVKM